MIAHITHRHTDTTSFLIAHIPMPHLIFLPYQALLGLGECAASAAEAEGHLRRCNELFDAMPANGSLYERRRARDALEAARRRLTEEANQNASTAQKP